MNVDLVPSLKATIQNPANLVEGVANEGWIRGGLPSRELHLEIWIILIAKTVNVCKNHLNIY